MYGDYTTLLYGDGFKHVFIFTPIQNGKWSHCDSYFSTGLWQPPTSHEWRPADEPLGGKGDKLHDAKIKEKQHAHK